MDVASRWAISFCFVETFLSTLLPFQTGKFEEITAILEYIIKLFDEFWELFIWLKQERHLSFTVVNFEIFIYFPTRQTAPLMLSKLIKQINLQSLFQLSRR